MRYLLVLLALAGCAMPAPTIHLRNPQTGQVASCGGDDMRRVSDYAIVAREQQCLADYQRQGYERI